jgi:hypothetical protein
MIFHQSHGRLVSYIRENMYFIESALLAHVPDVITHLIASFVILLDNAIASLAWINHNDEFGRHVHALDTSCHFTGRYGKHDTRFECHLETHVPTRGAHESWKMRIRSGTRGRWYISSACLTDPTCWHNNDLCRTAAGNAILERAKKLLEKMDISS